MTDTRHTHLLAAGQIGSLELRNRIIVTAMGVSLAEPDGSCGERLIAYHEAQAQGGAGLIIAGVCGVGWPVGAVLPNQTALSDDRFIPGLAELTDRVHRHGARIAAQLHHGGLPAGFSAAAFDVPLWAPCYPPPLQGDFLSYFLPEELGALGGAKPPALKVMTQEDIDLVVRQFADAARRARQAGFDGVEIHAAHGYLLSSFISPKTNSRTDDYGGPIENRLRFLLEVIAAIRAEVGSDFPLWCKLDAFELGKEGGITLADAITAATMVEAAGLDAITVSSYHNVGIGKLHSASNIPHEPESNVGAAAAVKAAVRVPVIGSGRIDTTAADRHIAQGSYDFLAMGRQLLADPDLPRKLAEGRADRVRPCIYCYTCVSAAYVGQPVRCAVNPRTGFECDPAPAAGAVRRYVVVGGGPGGIEAACRLAEAGHRVTLIEKSRQLGGTLRFAALAYPANQKLLDWLIARLERSTVEVKLGTEATPALLHDLGPDAVVVATGARREMPALPGHALPHVFSGDDLRNLLLGQPTAALKRKIGPATRLATRLGAATGLTANIGFVRNASRAWMPLGNDIVIVGGELVGLELAEFLHERGRRVTVIEPAPKLGKGLTLVRRMRLLAELKEHGVALHGGASDIVIDAQAVSFADSEGATHSVAADQVIVAMGATGDTTLADMLRAQGMRVELVGDCLGVSYIEGAIRGAADAVTRLSA